MDTAKAQADAAQLTVAQAQNRLDYLEGKVATVGNHQLRLQAAEVALEVAQAQLAKAEVEVPIAQATYQRAVASSSPVLVQKQALEDWQQAKVSVNQASLAVTQAQQRIATVP